MSWTHREKYLKEQLEQPGSRKLSLWLLYTCSKYHILSFREAQMDMDTHDLRSERQTYTILRPLSINRLFFLACLCISAASTSSFSDVEVRKLDAWTAALWLDAPRLSFMSFIAPVVLYMVFVALFAVSMMMSTTVFAREWNFAFPPRTSPDAVLQIVFYLLVLHQLILFGFWNAKVAWLTLLRWWKI